MQFILIGAGQRGMIYARYAHAMGHRIVAVADYDLAKRETACKEFGIPESRNFAAAEALLAQDIDADAAIIATMDRDHYGQAVKALQKGYHLLLEKPVSSVPEELMALEHMAKEMRKHVVVCHVLRYSLFFQEIKRHIESGVIGRVISIQHNENIGNYHMVHSFVRGNWRRKDLSSSLIMQKSCHDMDLLSWLVDSPCKSIASFGDLTYFKADHAPARAAKRCADCPLKDSCRFSAYQCYLPVMGNWPATAITSDQTEEGIREAIRTGMYGRCVYHCDNDVCDHQVTLLEFENGVTATFNLSGFTNRMTRTMKIMGEDGEIRISELDNSIEITAFASNGAARSESVVIHPALVLSGHGGGDSRMMDDFLSLLEGKTASAATEIDLSVESHIMSCAAEEARLTGKVFNIPQYKAQHTMKRS